jgi:hypothetical protein
VFIEHCLFGSSVPNFDILFLQIRQILAEGVAFPKSFQLRARSEDGRRLEWDSHHLAQSEGTFCDFRDLGVFGLRGTCPILGRFFREFEWVIWRLFSSSRCGFSSVDDTTTHIEQVTIAKRCAVEPRYGRQASLFD